MRNVNGSSFYSFPVLEWRNFLGHPGPTLKKLYNIWCFNLFLKVKFENKTFFECISNHPGQGWSSCLPYFCCCFLLNIHYGITDRTEKDETGPRKIDSKSLLNGTIISIFTLIVKWFCFCLLGRSLNGRLLAIDSFSSISIHIYLLLYGNTSDIGSRKRSRTGHKYYVIEI